MWIDSKLNFINNYIKLHLKTWLCGQRSFPLTLTLRGKSSSALLKNLFESIPNCLFLTMRMPDQIRKVGHQSDYWTSVWGKMLLNPDIEDPDSFVARKFRRRFVKMSDKDKEWYASEKETYVPTQGFGNDGKALAVGKGGKAKRTKKDKSLPKGALSSYIIFCTQMRSVIKAETPGRTPALDSHLVLLLPSVLILYMIVICCRYCQHRHHEAGRWALEGDECRAEGHCRTSSATTRRWLLTMPIFKIRLIAVWPRYHLSPVLSDCYQFAVFAVRLAVLLLVFYYFNFLEKKLTKLNLNPAGRPPGLPLNRKVLRRS